MQMEPGWGWGWGGGLLVASVARQPHSGPLSPRQSPPHPQRQNKVELCRFIPDVSAADIKTSRREREYSPPLESAQTREEDIGR